MILYLGCGAARQLLEAFVDDELPMSDQVALESHLRWCTTCRARVEDVRLIGASIRRRAPVPDSRLEEARVLAVIQSDVLTRIGAEREQSLPVRLREAYRRYAVSVACAWCHRGPPRLPDRGDQRAPGRARRSPSFAGRQD